MRASVIVLLGSFLGLAYGALGTGWAIVGSYPAPAANPRGVAHDAPYGASILCDGSPPRIYNMLRPSEYIKLAVPSGAWGLRSWGSDAILVSNYNNSHIYKLTTTGSVISSFRCPKDHPADLSQWTLHVAIPDENLAIKITTTGSILSSFRGPGTRLTAIDASDILGDPETHKVYFLGYGTRSLGAPVGACSFRLTDGPPYVWPLVVDSATNYIYEFEWCGYEALGPASFGRVKALFK